MGWLVWYVRMKLERSFCAQLSSSVLWLCFLCASRMLSCSKFRPQTHLAQELTEYQELNDDANLSSPDEQGALEAGYPVPSGSPTLPGLVSNYFCK